MVLPVPPPEELLVLSLLGEQEAEEVEKAAVSAMFVGSSAIVELPCVTRSSRSTKEEEKVSAWDCCTPRDQKVPTEHRPSPSKAPIFTTCTRFSTLLPLSRNDGFSISVRDHFVGPRGRTGHDDTIERLCRSRIAVAEFSHPRSSRSGGSLPCSSIRRRVSFKLPSTKAASNPAESEEICSGTFVQSTQSALQSCSAIFSSLDEYVGRGEAYDRAVLYLFRASHSDAS